MIEVVGVLAILAILAGILVSNVTRRLDIAAANVESATMANYATALQNSILRSRYIPGRSDWATNIAAELGADIASVTNTPRKLSRAFVIDPALAITTGMAGLPYAQSNMLSVLTNAAATNGVMAQPTSARVMLVSSLGAVLPAFILSGTVSSTDFNSLWNWADQSSTPPAGWPATWNNRGGDLVVQRINLAPLFVHLVLENYPPWSGSQGQYGIDLVGPSPVPPTTTGVNAYLLKNTILGLYEDSSLGNALEAKQILSRDASFFYILQTWHGSVDFGSSMNQSLPNAVVAGGTFSGTAMRFASSCYNKNATGGVTPPMVVSDIASFMSAYDLWAQSAYGSFYSNSVFLAQFNLVNHLNGLTNSLTSGGCNSCPP